MEAFDTWAAQAQLPNTQALKDIGHATEPPFIGIDARYFLEQVYWPDIDEFAAALGGFPFAFETQVIKAIENIESAGCKLHFVFNGLQTNFDEPSFDNSISEIVARAFKAYRTRGRDEQAKDLFNSSGFPPIDWLCVALKITLGKHGNPFTVAPFKAHAQLVYALEKGAVDALYGPSELFLYGAPKVITKIRVQSQSDAWSGDVNGQTESRSNADQSRIVWLELDQCLKMLGDISFEVFQNALLLAGTKSLEAFPPLKESIDSQASLPFKEVVATLNQMNGNVFHFCERYPPAIRGDWVDRYMRAHQAIKHMVIMFDYETVKPRTYVKEEEVGHIPVDIHELVGLQLPAELHHYLYHGMIGSRVLDWLISGKIKLPAPLAGGENEVYRKLVREQLDPWRKQTLALIAFTLSRYYQRKEFTTQVWYGNEAEQKFSMGDLSSEKPNISGWRVKEADLNSQLNVVRAKSSHIALGSLQFAVMSIADAKFTPKTVSSARRSSSEAQLQSIEEITCNVLWRFLQIRGYIDKEHRLTDWGKILLAAIESVGDSNEQAESMFLVVELMRLDLVDKAPVFHESLGGAPGYGSETDRKNCMLVSSIACTGKLMHNQTQYKGPLNYNDLAYHCLIGEIRLALRDLIDMILATMFLDDEIERIRDDHLKIAATLPFRDHWTVGLGILTTLFLDELAATGLTNDKHNEQNNNEPEDVIGLTVQWMPRAKVKESLRLSGKLWDAFIVAIKSAPADIVSNEQKEAWSKTDDWYSTYRAHIDD